MGAQRDILGAMPWFQELCDDEKMPENQQVPPTPMISSKTKGARWKSKAFAGVAGLLTVLGCGHPMAAKQPMLGQQKAAHSLREP